MIGGNIGAIAGEPDDGWFCAGSIFCVGGVFCIGCVCRLSAGWFFCVGCLFCGRVGPGTRGDGEGAGEDGEGAEAGALEEVSSVHVWGNWVDECRKKSLRYDQPQKWSIQLNVYASAVGIVWLRFSRKLIAEMRK